MNKTFITITAEVYNNRLVYLATSAGNSITDVNGIDYKQAVDFLFALVHKRKRKGNLVFVCFGFQRNNEYMFATMPTDLKDKLFKSYRIQKEIDRLEYDLESITDDYYLHPQGTAEFELADFEKYVTELALNEITDVKFDDYNLCFVNGKFLTIRKGKKSITIYDIHGFFGNDNLRQAVYRYTGEQQPLLESEAFNALDFFDGETELDRLKNHAAFEMSYVQRLVETLYKKLIACDIPLSKFHGATAVTSYILSKAGAKKQYHNYRYGRQLSPSIDKSIRQATFGGRGEQLKIGTLEDVKIFDINSAYAHAAMDLPIMLTKPISETEWNDNPYSYWYCDYDFTKAGLYFGLLPNRELTNFTKYKLRGSGYFWQPEINHVLRHYPQCITIGHGYSLSKERATFGDAIQYYYGKRLELIANDDPLERVLKLALSSIYGKFCQHNGKGYYYNLFYAAYITSFTRAKLLQSVLGYENETICFLTDAIHTTADLPVEVSDKLGAFKVAKYDKATYLDNGVYQCYRDGQAVKTATRGFRRFNFDQCLKELHNKRTYTALAEFFVGYNLFSRNLFTGAAYLTEHGAMKTMNPTDRNMTAMRHYMCGEVDLTMDFLDSDPIVTYNGLESSPYYAAGNKQAELALAMEAVRLM